MKISVIVPVYKTEQYLRGCLQSVLAQTYQDFEIICVNDGSPDDSARILQEMSQQDARIQVIYQENRGLSGARNTGMRYASGEYIYYLDSDDYLHPRTFEILMGIAIATGVDILQPDFVRTEAVYEQAVFASLPEFPSMYVTEDPLEDYCHKGGIKYCIVCGKLYKKELLRNHSFVEGLMYEDEVFSPQVLSSARSMAVVDVQLLQYFRNINSITAQGVSAKQILAYFTIIRELYSYFKARPAIKSKFRIFKTWELLRDGYKDILRLKDKQLQQSLLELMREQTKGLLREGILGYREFKGGRTQKIKLILKILLRKV